MAKSNDKTHQKRMDNKCHIPDLVRAFSNRRKWWIEPGFIAPLTCNTVSSNSVIFTTTDIINKIVKIWAQQTRKISAVGQRTWTNYLKSLLSTVILPYSKTIGKYKNPLTLKLIYKLDQSNNKKYNLRNRVPILDYSQSFKLGNELSFKQIFLEGTP